MNRKTDFRAFCLRAMELDGIVEVRCCALFSKN